MENELVKIDQRARLTSKAVSGTPAFEQVFGPNVEGNILYPLHRTEGIIFPYTPTVQWSGEVNYQELHTTHSNYKYNSFENGAPGSIQMDCVFTAQTDAEARYLLAVLHFLKSATKMYFGEKAGNLAGTPPPVLKFRYLGNYMFNDVPVVIKSYQYILDNTVDYVQVKFPNNPENSTRVPAQMNISMELGIQMNTQTVRKEFNLESFTSGDYVNNDSTFKGWM